MSNPAFARACLVLCGLLVSPIWSASAQDCNGNGIPDGCDIDCGPSGGSCDLPGCGQSEDCNLNGVPDECDLVSEVMPNGVVVWLSADYGVESGPEGVARWGDRSGGQHDFVASGGGQPQLVPAVVNQRPVVRFDGVNDRLHNGETLLSGHAFTIFTVLSVTAGDYPWELGAAASYRRVFYESGTYGGGSPDVVDIAHDNYNDARATYPGISAPGFRVLSIQCNEHVYGTTVFVNGAAAAMSFTSGDLVWDIGGGDNNLGSVTWATPTQVDIAEFLVFDRVLGVAERISVERFLAWKYFNGPDPRDCNNNGIPDTCELATGVSADCNLNGVLDECDIGEGASTDCDGNGVPDDCQPDCNLNGVADACDIASGFSFDCQPNGVPDECEVASVVQDGLALWLRADALAGYQDGDAVASWPDDSANQFTVTQASGSAQPHLYHDGPAGLPVLRFDGGDYLSRDGVAGAALSGTDQITVFMVMRQASSTLASIFRWYGSPAGDEIRFRSLTDPARLYFRHGDGTSQGAATWDQPSDWVGAFHIVSISRAAGTARLAIDGQAQGDRTLSDTLDTAASGTLNVGAGGFTGDIAEMLLYSRTLSPAEAAHVGTYLAIKYSGATLGPDCNANGVPDSCDIAGGAPDCDTNGVPDVCQSAGNDCNANAVLDSCDIAAGTSLDVNGNGIPDECEIDCNGNGIPDGLEISQGLAPDCNANGVPDDCDIAGGASADCDANGVPDDCQPDCQPNGIPDACEAVSAVQDGLALWLRADALGGYQDGDPVGSWPDESPNGFTVAQVYTHSQPHFYHAGPAGLPVLSYDGNDYLIRSNVLGEALSSPDGVTIYIVMRQATSALASILRWTPPTEWIRWRSLIDPARLEFVHGEPASASVTWDQPIDWVGSFHIVCVSRAGGIARLSVDRNAQGDRTLGDTLDTSLSSTLYVGGMDFMGDIAEVLIYSRALDPVEAARVSTYLAVKYAGGVLVPDCNGNGIPDECEIAAPGGDCNANGVPDDCDITAGVSPDCNVNGVPDECEPLADCNGNGQLDVCDLMMGVSSDCNANQIPDECDIFAGTSVDCDSNLVPDECQVTLDCNGNGTFDPCEVVAGTATDCNGNGLLDECEEQGGQVVLDGLRVWLRASDFSGGAPQPVDTWPNASGTGESFTQANTAAQPTWVPELINGFPAVHFDGNDFLARAAVLGTSLAGAESVTVFFVARENAAGGCGSVFGWGSGSNRVLVHATCEGTLSLQHGDPDSGGKVDWIAPAGWTGAFHVAVFQRNDASGTARIDGVDLPAGSFADAPELGEVNPLWIGSDMYEDFFHGDLAELLIYDRALSLSELLLVELHLRQKYDLSRSRSDCNGNGVFDACDVAWGTSEDCNSDWIPDECQTDCNGNGVPDDCDIATSVSLDCNANGVPDECDLVDGTSQDCNENGVPDECDIAGGTSQDCNANATPDECDLSAGTSPDCNSNDIPDECDIDSGTSTDVNGDGIPDDCQTDIRVIAVPVTINPASTSDHRNSQPTGVSGVTRGSIYWVEIWASDVGTTNTGLTGVYVDLAFCDVTTPLAVSHGNIFTTFPSGTLLPHGVDEFGGSALPHGGGIQPEWVRVGWITMRADLQTEACSINLASSSTGVAAYQRGLILWPFVRLEPAELAIFTPTVNYDLDTDGFVGVGDLSLFAGSWLQPVPPGSGGHDFDCDDYVGVGDLSWFATAWLRYVTDPNIQYSPGCSGQSRHDGGATRTADIDFKLVAVAAPSATDLTTTLPASLNSVQVGQTYYVEVWVSDVGDINTGLTSAYIDVSYPNASASVTQISHTSLFNVFPSGQDVGGLIDELGGSNLPGGIGIAPQWARVAVIQVHADAASSSTTYGSAPSSTGVAALARGVIAWTDIALGQVTLVHQAGVLPGDLNCDGSVSFSDINPFVLILTNPAAWQAAHPGCPFANGDINGDSFVSFSDINPFVMLLSGS